MNKKATSNKPSFPQNKFKINISLTVIIILLIIIAFLVGRLENFNNQNKPLEESFSQDLTPSPSPSPYPTLTDIPTNIPEDKPLITPDTGVSDARALKEKELEKIDLLIKITKENLKVYVDSHVKLIEEYKKCTNNDCQDYYLKALKMIENQIDSVNKDIKDLELQRATIISGL